MTEVVTTREKFRVWFSVVRAVTKLTLRKTPSYVSPWASGGGTASGMTRPAPRPVEPLPEMTDEDFEESAEEILSSLSVVTVTYDHDSSGPPVVNLGNVNPVFAASMLDRAVETLQMMTPYPEVYYQGDLVFDPYPMQ